jgi:HAD superfamily hydrolase (TIGR01509 family)
MLTALCIDLMDTLVTDPYREALRAATGLELRDIAAVRDPAIWPAFEVGAIDEDEFARRFFADPSEERAFDLAAFHRVRRAGCDFLPGMEALLDATRGRLDRHIASNYPVWIREVVVTLGIGERVEGVHASHDLGVRKPDPAFYDRLLERIGHPPAACLFVDDRERNCAAAEDAGMRAHLFTGAEDLRRRLVLEGVLDQADARPLHPPCDGFG